MLPSLNFTIWIYIMHGCNCHKLDWGEVEGGEKSNFLLCQYFRKLHAQIWNNPRSIELMSLAAAWKKIWNDVGLTNVQMEIDAYLVRAAYEQRYFWVSCAGGFLWFLLNLMKVHAVPCWVCSALCSTVVRNTR